MKPSMLASLLVSLPLVLAVDLLSGHSLPKMVVIPSNLTLMTPRVGSSLHERQIFDFGSGQSGFTELKRVLERQSTCATGYGNCPNRAGCCQVGGDCCDAGGCCGSGKWCYGGGCCLRTQNGCDDKGCCGKSEQCCKGGQCCAGGNNCVIVNGKLGCCPIGQTCTAPTCDAGYFLCSDQKFCCPTGNVCYRDNAGNAKCQDPTIPSPTPSPTPSPSTYIAPQPDPTTVVETTTYVPPAPEPSTVVIQTTQTQVITQTVPGSSTLRASSSVTRPTSSQAIQTNATIGSSTKSNVGAIAGGVAAGVVAIIAIVVIIIFMLRRNKKQEQPSTGAQPASPQDPPPAGQYNESHPGGIPPTPGSGDPFLTPMNQHQNLGVSYFGGAPSPASPGPTEHTGSGSGPYNASQYSGLPEPQQNDMAGAGIPQPRYDSTHPRPLPMSIVHSQQPESPSGGNIARPWSGYAPSPAAAPYAASNNTQPSGWSAPTNNSGWASPPPQAQPAYMSPPYADGPGRPASTVYQASSNAPYSPPGSPPLPEVYGGMAPSGSSGLPAGAAPPMNMYPNEKKAYQPYQ